MPESTISTPQEVADLLQGPILPHALEKIAACGTADEAIRMAYSRLAKFGQNPGLVFGVKGIPVPEGMPPLEVPNIPKETIEFIIRNTKSVTTLRNILSSVFLGSMSPDSIIREKPDAPMTHDPIPKGPIATETLTMAEIENADIEHVRIFALDSIEKPDSIPHIARRISFMIAETLTVERMPPKPEILTKRPPKPKSAERATFEVEKEKAINARILQREEILLEVHREVCAALEKRDPEMQRTLERFLSEELI